MFVLYSNVLFRMLATDLSMLTQVLFLIFRKLVVKFALEIFKCGTILLPVLHLGLHVPVLFLGLLDLSYDG